MEISKPCAKYNTIVICHTFSTKIYFTWNRGLKIFIISTISIKINTIILFRSLHYCRKMEKQWEVCSSFFLTKHSLINTYFHSIKLQLKYTGTYSWKSTRILWNHIFPMPVKCVTISNTWCSMLQFKCFLLNLTVCVQSSPNHPKTVIHSGWRVYS